MRMRKAFGLWLRDRLKELDIKQEVFADLMGVSQSTVSRWINGGEITAGRIWPMAAILKVRVPMLLQLAAEEDIIDAKARIIAEEQFPYQLVPITGAASANPDRSMVPEDHVIVKTRGLKRYPGRMEALEIVGDCLEPKIPNGGVAIVDPDIPWRPGQTIAIRVDGGIQVKILKSYSNGRLVLTSRYGEMIVSDEDGRIAGVVVAVQQYLDV